MRIPVLCALVLAAACGLTEEAIQQARCAGERPYRDMTNDELEDERTRIIRLEMRAIMATREIKRQVPTTLLPPKVEAALERFARDKEEAESAAAAFRIEEECRRAAEASAVAEAEQVLGRADQGDAEAQFNMGVLHSIGHGVQQDTAEAARWYRLAAEKGYADAQHQMGVIRSLGLGVPRNDREAVRWLRLAAEQGHAVAQLSLGNMYRTGRGVAQNDREAVRWWELAAGQGDELAQYNLERIEAR